ncbi:hypothetical protein [Rodentibacter pneumotropicus]|uniref:Uncharacterized protein n=1 Tax=Rodentibacter pneumotropicus TaxID=758 RepID=A0A4S2Q6Y1_9PAST|nr:hypothetical protein [Rodentibacter pneumotropicus]THA00501.1 hypothetical protein D3M79_04225 [Rodentibacter pneumotropicus]THA11934.1 hypothetical protein D3M76_10660 [Rodentibacter pneumotropicus]
MTEFIHNIVTSDYFTFFVGLSSIISIFLGGTILCKININSKLTKIDNKGNENIISGRDSNVKQ